MTSTRDTYLLLRAFVDELARCGMRAACTSPGSRSAPLVLSLARDRRIRCFSHIDERSAGFFALGLAKASGAPVAIACTSGTAAAEYAPAVIEARQAGVPLIVLTADRPPELRDVGAGQTIDQLGLYGSAAKWFFELGTHDATPARLRWIRGLACRVYWTALADRCGPVHVNVALREPLVLDEPLEDDESGRHGERPWVTRPPAERQLAPAGLDGLAGAIEGRPSGVVVAGAAPRAAELGAAVTSFAQAAGYALLADPLSGARFGPAAIAHYDALLRDPSFAEALVPEFVLRVGDLPTSRPLRAWLASLPEQTLQVALDPDGAWQDPDAVVGTRIAADEAPLLHELGARLGGAERHTDWLDAWRAADRRASAAIAGALGEALSEPRVAAELGVRLSAAATVFVASSMPVRDVETFFPVREDPPRVLSNRGANGIDGTVAAAYGAAAASAGPVVLLIGDVALAHDVGGLLAGARSGTKLTIVLVNNGGGGIFDFLPVAGETDAYEEHVATPPGLDFAALAAVAAADHLTPGDPPAFRAALDRALASPRTTIVEVRTERSANVALHRRVWDAVASAIAA